jgi:hypothetical protein
MSKEELIKECNRILANMNSIGYDYRDDSSGWSYGDLYDFYVNYAPHYPNQ